MEHDQTTNSRICKYVTILIEAEKGSAMYEYRNIDTDVKLLKFARRYHSEDITLNQLEYIAGLEGYSKKEIECAIYDYYLIYIRPDELVKNYILPIGLALFILLILIKLFTSVDRGIWQSIL